MDEFLGKTDEEQIKMLMDTDLVLNKLNINEIGISLLIAHLSNEFEEDKLKLMKIYQFDDYSKASIIKTFSIDLKIPSMLAEKELNREQISSILKTLDNNTLSLFFLQHKEYCIENDIYPYDIVSILDSQQQKDFVINMENFEFTLNEKLEILATLNEDVKQSIDTSSFSKEYKTAITMQTAKITNANKQRTVLHLDLDRNPEDFRGLDNLILVNPEKYTEDQRVKLMRICSVCPNLQVVSTLDDFIAMSTGSEYLEAEEWINSLIDSLNPEYSKAQKLAIIDHAIGKKMSYSPDAHTEVFDKYGNRALWKAICSGYGVCNVIALIEQYILNRIDINSQFVSTGQHVFLLIKDIELPFANGEIKEGDTILDPTWNLTSHRFRLYAK